MLAIIKDRGKQTLFQQLYIKIYLVLWECLSIKIVRYIEHFEVSHLTVCHIYPGRIFSFFFFGWALYNMNACGSNIRYSISLCQIFCWVRDDIGRVYNVSKITFNLMCPPKNVCVLCDVLYIDLKSIRFATPEVWLMHPSNMNYPIQWKFWRKKRCRVKLIIENFTDLCFKNDESHLMGLSWDSLFFCEFFLAGYWNLHIYFANHRIYELLMEILCIVKSRRARYPFPALWAC